MTASVFEEDHEACRRVGMRDFVGKPIDLAQIDALLSRVAVERGLSRRDDKAIEQDAHSLRSTSATVGATVMSSLSGSVEGAARVGRFEEIGALLDALRAEVTEVEHALAAELGDERPPRLAQVP